MATRGRPVQFKKNTPGNIIQKLRKLLEDADTLRRETSVALGRGNPITKRIGVIHSKVEDVVDILDEKTDIPRTYAPKEL